MHAAFAQKIAYRDNSPIKKETESDFFINKKVAKAVSDYSVKNVAGVNYVIALCKSKTEETSEIIVRKLYGKIRRKSPHSHPPRAVFGHRTSDLHVTNGRMINKRATAQISSCKNMSWNKTKIVYIT